MGKVLVIKTEIIASIAFLATALPVPNVIMASLRKAMFGFLWGGQHEKVEREIMYRPVEKGGRAFPGITIKLKAMFVSPIISTYLNTFKESPWSYIAKFWVEQKVLVTWGKRVGLKTPFLEQHPRIYKEVIKTLSWEITQLHQS